MASAVCTRAIALAAQQGWQISSDEQELMACATACYFYCKMDPMYQSRSTLDASGSFINDPKMPEYYKSMAVALDPSGNLNALLSSQRASVGWMGKPVSDQIAYWDRN
jgi:hypothetical protein